MMKLQNQPKSSGEGERDGRCRSWQRFKEAAAGLACAAGIGCVSANAMAAGPATTETPTAPSRAQISDVEVTDVSRAVGGVVILTTEAQASQERTLYSWFVFDKYDVSVSDDARALLQEFMQENGDLAPADEGEHYFLRNPEFLPHGMRYIGVVDRDRALGNGDVADVVLEIPEMPIEASFTPTHIMVAFALARGNVLFRLEPGTLEPVVDEALARDMGDYAFQTTRPYLETTIFNGVPEASCIVAPMDSR